MFDKWVSNQGYTWSSQKNNSGQLFSYIDLNLAGNSLSPQTPGTGAWKHLVLVRNGNSTIMYLNGSAWWTTTSSTTSAPTANNSDLYLGHDPTDNEYGDGRFAHARIYDVPLSAAQVQQNYDAIPAALKS